MPTLFTPPSVGIPQPIYDAYGKKTDDQSLVAPPNYYGTKYTGSGAFTIPGIQTDPYGYNTGWGKLTASNNPFAAGDFSGLNSEQQATARSVQDAFKSSLGQYGRESMRYSAPMLSNVGKDMAIAQANTTASLLNSNQQAGAARDAYLSAFNKSPTTMQNLAALTSLLSGGLNLANQSGLLSLIKQGISGGWGGTPNNVLAPNDTTSGIYGNPADTSNPLTGGPSSYDYGADGTPYYLQPPALPPPSDVITTPYTGYNPDFDYGQYF